MQEYTAHIVRKTHQVELEKAVLEGLDKTTGVGIHVDNKMKMLALVWRESMPMFYAKRGFSWCGVSFTRFKRNQDLVNDTSKQKVRYRCF
jgi:hypothetical protein